MKQIKDLMSHDGKFVHGGTKVRDIMSKGVAWAYEDDSVDKAAMIMRELQVQRLPVVDRDKRLVGTVALGEFAVEGSDARPVAREPGDSSGPA